MTGGVIFRGESSVTLTTVLPVEIEQFFAIVFYYTFMQHECLCERNARDMAV